MRFVREKSVKSGEKYKDVNLYQLTTEQYDFSRKRTRKKLSTPKQVKQDWNYARQYATQFVNANFGEGDYLVDLTYDEEPPDREQAERNVKNCVARLERLYKKNGLEFKAFWVTGGGRSKKEGGVTRFHHHLIIKGGLDRDIVEAVWNLRNKNRVKTSRVKIRNEDFGLEPRVLYMVKPAHCSPEPNAKRWHTCGMRRKPIETRNDTRYDSADMHRLIKLIKEGRAQAYIERQYKGWELIEAKDKISDVTGLPYIRIKLRKKNTS